MGIATNRAYLSLGCNIGECRRNLAVAVARLDAACGSDVTAVSSVYLTEPVGGVEQPDFLNLAVELKTAMDPMELLQLCRSIEEELGGRKGREPMGPRSIDIDILLHGDTQMETDELRLPHPQIADRAFVLVPLVEIAPDVIIPGIGKASEVLAVLDDPHAVGRDGRLEELKQ